MIKNRATAEILDDLRQRIAHLEWLEQSSKGWPAPLAFDIAAIDQCLPWGGLAPAALHEIIPAGPGVMMAALGFATACLGLAARRAPILWCRSSENRYENLYAPGLEKFGLCPNNLIIVNAGGERELLWAMEEALHNGALAAVLGEVQTLTAVSSRRLQLAAERGATMAFLLRNRFDANIVTSAMTRWQINAAVSNHPLGPWPGATRWAVILERCRGGVSGNWNLEWKDANIKDPGPGIEAGSFRLVTTLRDGSIYPAASAADSFFGSE